jgi:hypothetical protein
VSPGRPTTASPRRRWPSTDWRSGKSVLGQDAVVPWPVPVAQLASAGGADFAHIAGANGAGSDGGSTTPLSASIGPHTTSSFMAPRQGAGMGLGPPASPRLRQGHPGQLVVHGRRGQAGRLAGTRPAHPGRADVRPCRRRWTAPLRPGRADSVLCRYKFSTARGGGISVPQLPKRGRTWPPIAPTFPPRRSPDGDAIGSNPQPTRDRQEPARPRKPRATLPYPPNTRSIDHA